MKLNKSQWQLDFKFQNLNIINADCMYILNENRQIICSTDISLLGNVLDGFELSTNACGSYSSAGKLYSYADMRSAVPAISYDKSIASKENTND